MRIAAFFICLLILGGCQQPKPPQGKLFNLEESMASASGNKEIMTEKHLVQGQDLMVECIIPSIRLSGENPAKIAVYIDGRLDGNYETAAFIVRGLSKGVHHIKLDLIKSNHKRYGITKEFYVTIQ
ncbi:hypothetical protein [Falsibacillus pallidus]|uniref:Lipoprotein n=1 Tax=Falsibacillus pallidus TaxID=493781 RepID=A0A370GWF0_9BACI|nr:hypothetical protein [Falsibacillus pallidus]RDI47580.1 hypothetical protein DFR59_101239 [Falsibacillus pallidus]